MRKLARTQLRPFAMSTLKKQNGNCAICGLPVDTSVPKEAVVDHNHTTGEIRGVIHRSCNAAEGKVRRAAGCFGAKSMADEAVEAWLKKLLDYYAAPYLGVIYPEHRTPEQKKAARNLSVRKRRAAARAKKAMEEKSK